MIKMYLLLLFIIVPLFVFSQDENLNVLSGIKFSDVENELYHYYADTVFKAMDKREMEIAACTTIAQWEKRQEKVRQLFAKVVGEFPSKTPLNARIVDIVEKKRYRVEKIVYESHPRFFVTAVMYIPNDLKGKAPAIVFTSGHAKEAFRWQSYQQVCINFVEKGFIVFAFDPVSQGERIQYFDADSKTSKVGGCTAEHTYEGSQCLFIGKSLANYMIWDGIRAVDYLLTRPEVDAQRIGITGHSGGGTQSSYIAAFDKRIYAVAPECFIISMKRLWETIGPQDAEQVLYHGVANGLDFADLLEVRAPKPVLQITTTRDFFSIQGARETGAEVKNVYKIFNASEKFSRIEDDAPHEVTKKNRIKRNIFFQKYLELPGSSADNPVEFLTPEELQITTTGQVLTSLGGETIFSLNKKDAEKFLDKLEQSRKNPEVYLKNVVSSAVTISGYKAPVKLGKAVFTGRYVRDGYVIEKYYISGEGDYPIPFLLFIPNKCSGSPVIYLNPAGKASTSLPSGEIEMFVKKGHTVLAADLIGFGEMKQKIPSWSKFRSGLGEISDPHWGSPIAVGGSIVGLHAGDIQRLVLYLKKRSDLKSKEIFAVAKGDICPALLHVAAIEKSFSKIALIDPLISYRTIIMNKFYKLNPMFPLIPSVLTAYDLPDLITALAPKKLLIVNAHDQLCELASDELINRDYKFVKNVYLRKGYIDNLVIKTEDGLQDFSEVFSRWLDK
ncbi:acetylxylan esterase [bacterium]|nr:acetylxylan esterase [bacterium]